jgi:acyl-CoA dehydrogenase
VADLTVALLGGGLKVKQKITGRMADALAELYLLSALLKRYDDDGRPRADLKLVDYAAQNCLWRFDQALAGVIDNFPVTWAAILMRVLVFPLGVMRRPASDREGKTIARAVLEPGDFRDRLTRDIFITHDPADRVGLLEHTLVKVVAAEEADKKLERAIRNGEVRRTHDRDWIAEAKAKGVLSDSEAEALAELNELTARVIAVDAFDAREVVGQHAAQDRAPEAMPQPAEHIAAE